MRLSLLSLLPLLLGVLACGGNEPVTPAPIPAVVISTTQVPGGEVGVPYTKTLDATGGTGSYLWTLAGGALPTGLTLSGGGTVSGVPGASGPFVFSAQVASGSKTAVKEYGLVVAPQPPPALLITTSSLLAGAMGEPYRDSLRATGGVGSYVWTMFSGTMPQGLTLGTSGLIQGTPLVYGSLDLFVRVSSGTQSTNTNVRLVIAPPPVIVATATLPAGIVGQVYSTNLGATGGTGSYDWSIVAGLLPAGVQLAYSNTGALIGIPTTAGTSTFTVRVQSGSRVATRDLSIAVIAALRVTTPSLPNGTVGVPYSTSLTAAGGAGLYDWNLQSGLLPPGLGISNAGVLSGTPSAAYTSNFVVEVSDGTQFATKLLSVTIAP